MSRQGEGSILPAFACWALSLSASTVEVRALAGAGGLAACGSPDVANSAVRDGETLYPCADVPGLVITQCQKMRTGPRRRVKQVKSSAG